MIMRIKSDFEKVKVFRELLYFISYFYILFQNYKLYKNKKNFFIFSFSVKKFKYLFTSIP